MVAKKYKDKEALVGSLHSKLDAATAIVITEYRGIKAGELVRLRRELRDAQVEVLVVKNSLLKRAAQGTNCESLVGELVGPTAVAVAYGDASEAAKLLAKGESDFAPFNLQSGIIENSVLDASGIAMIAKLPGKAEMHAQFAGLLEGAVAEFAMVINAVLSEFVGLAEAKVEKDGAAA